jgi:hypothetical protein
MGSSTAFMQDHDSMRHHRDELHQLHAGQTRLPPNGQGFAGLGDLGVHANEVVRVHHSVDESVQENGKKDITVEV